MRDGGPLEVLSSRKGDILIVSARGEIDLASAPEFVSSIQHMLDMGSAETNRVIVDLTEVGFLDSSGLNALVRLQRLLDQRGIAVRLVSPPNRVVHQVFEITDLVGPLHVVDSLDDALA
jgi:anti-sigma B factor antagonist